MKIRIIILTIILMLTAPMVMATDNVLTLEQAKELTKSSRNLAKYDLSVEKAKYSYYQAQDAYDDAKTPSYYNLLPYYFYLNEQQAQGNDVSLQLANVEKQISSAKEKLDSEVDRASSLRDTMLDREESYDKAKQDRDNYRKQLDYTIEQLYTSILGQEDRLAAQQKELEYKLLLLNIEKQKLQLGNSTQGKVDKLAIETSTLNKSIIEAANSLKNSKSKFNDMLGRDPESALTLVHFTVPETAVIPTAATLYAKVSQDYDKILQLEKDIKRKQSDLDDEDVKDTAYQSDLIRLEIKEKELQIEDERLALKESINNLITEMKSKQKNFQLAKIEWDSTQKSFAWNKMRFETGRISKSEYLQNEFDYLAAQNKFISAGYDFFLTKHSLQLLEEGIFTGI
ncbi:MAG: TolC family protein [Bacillota bacterium]